MKIAQIAPLIESVPPRLYGGTERIVSYLTEELVSRGHEVTLFASADSVTSAELVGCARVALRLDPHVRDPLPYYMLMLDRVRRQADRFDVLHFHIDYLHFPLFRDIGSRALTTLHGRQDMPDGKALYIAFDDLPLISISDNQRRPIAGANFAATIHHGIPQRQFAPPRQPRGDYLAFLGRISPEKGPERAIAIAKAAGLPLKLAAKIDKVDVEYFKAVVEPLLDDPLIEFVGEIGDHQKAEFLGNAMALLFPIDWPEPFGIVLIEAMACGTPIVAFRRGAVAEIIEPGLTGAIVDDIAGAVAAIPAVRALDRAAIRTRFERRFTAAKMAEKHIQLYERVIASAERSADRETAMSPTTAKVSN